VTADVALAVPPLVIGEWGGNFDPSSATQHEELGELLLHDQTLLEQADGHIELPAPQPAAGPRHGRLQPVGHRRRYGTDRHR